MLGRTLHHALRQALAPSQARQFTASAPVAGWWHDVPQAPKDPILGVTEAFLADKDPNKMNLGVGAYRDDKGKPVVLDCVRKAEEQIAGQLFMEYSPMAGSADFNSHAIKLAYGEDSPLIKDGHIAAVQTLSGTGACRLFGDFIHQYYPDSGMLLPTPTWSNHLGIFKDANVKTTNIRYYDPKTKGLDFKGFVEDLKAAPKKSFVLFHACAHNPTGVDPSPEQWKEISAVVKEKQQYPLFDMAYQGFASGDTERDAASIRIFLEDGHQVAVSQSFAKNMGLYGQRIGCLSVVTESPQETTAVRGQIQLVARKQYSNPPIHGALLVTRVLSSPDLKQLWYKEVQGMADRIISMRHALRSNLEAAGSKLPWNHITDQIGMFCFTGISPEQVDRLTHDHHIYLTRNGRISIAGINTGNVERLAHALHEVTK